MSSQSLHKFFHLCSFMISFCMLSAQENECALPPPAWLQDTEIGTTFISVEWAAVPGAVAYQVVTKETDTGTIVDVGVTSNLSYTINNLTPDTNYTIEVSASACPNGPWGPPISIYRSTSIVVVDVVVQLQDCNPGGLPSYYTPGNSSNIDVELGSEFLLVEGEFTSTASSPAYAQGEKFFIVINPDFGINKMRTGLAPGTKQIQKTRLSGGAMLKAYPNQTTLTEFMKTTVNFTRNPSGNRIAKVTIEWNAYVSFIITTCDSGIIIPGGDEGGSGIDGLQSAGSGDLPQEGTDQPLEKHNTEVDYELTIAPNPANAYINIEGIEFGEVIDVFDLQGRSWYRQVADGQHMRIDISNLPSGTYMLRTMIDGKPTIQRFIKV